MAKKSAKKAAPKKAVAQKSPAKPAPKQQVAKKASSKKSTPPKKSPAKPQMSEADGLRKLFIDELKDIYWAEKALTKALPKMSKNATSDDLADALDDHLSETEGQITTLEKVFSVIGEKVAAKKCEAMAGLVKEATEIMEDSPKGAVRDAGIISAGQKVEHYEIASYGTLCALAKTLGLTEAKDLLGIILDQEKAADEKLSQLAESHINADAANS